MHKRNSHLCKYYTHKSHSINQRTADSADMYDNNNIVDVLEMRLVHFIVIHVDSTVSA